MHQQKRNAHSSNVMRATHFEDVSKAHYCRVPGRDVPWPHIVIHAEVKSNMDFREIWVASDIKLSWGNKDVTAVCIQVSTCKSGKYVSLLRFNSDRTENVFSQIQIDYAAGFLPMLGTQSIKATAIQNTHHLLEDPGTRAKVWSGQSAAAPSCFFCAWRCLCSSIGRCRPQKWLGTLGHIFWSTPWWRRREGRAQGLK